MEIIVASLTEIRATIQLFTHVLCVLKIVKIMRMNEDVILVSGQLQ